MMSIFKKAVYIFSLLAGFVLTSPHFTQAQGRDLFFFSHYKLKNGLEVILSEDLTLPLVSVVVGYRAGSLDEQPGKTGLAYLMENLMFQGSSNVSPMQHISFIQKTGGMPNASTTEDITLFYQTVPSHQLALVLWLESDRMRFLDINTAKVEAAKEGLVEEIKQRKADELYLESFWAFDQLLYPDFSHRHPVIGNERDIRNLTVEDVREFYARYYVPNNAVLCIAGNIHRSKTVELVEKYFGSLPQGKEVPPRPSPLPSQKKEVTQTYVDALVPAPGFHLSYRVAPPYSQDFYALILIDYILIKGKSSRLQRRLLKRELLATHLSGGIERRKDVAAFKIFAINSTEIMAERSQRAIFSEISRLKTSLIGEEELQKAKNMLRMDYFSRLTINLDRAILLCEFFFSGLPPDEFARELDKYLRVAAADIIGIANRYFIPENMAILNIKTR